MVRLGGLWKNVDKQGAVYLSGDFGSAARMVILPNKHKTESRHPDYHVYVDNKEQVSTIPLGEEL